jgi:hypothetical protein
MTKEQHKAYYQYRLGKNPSYKAAAITEKEVEEYQRRYHLNAVRSRARRGGLPFNLTIEDIVIPTVCPVLGITLSRGSGYRSGCSPSIDRINPSLGYVKGNIIVVSMRANEIKRDSTWPEIMKVAEFYRNLELAKNHNSADNVAQ